ncbi:MAG: SpoIIE family protein phosphatase [Akkermansiaceae bacterium]|nr:SpoIIE family protein phosphatase [Akkermansiaceae bacterium]
MTSKPPTPDPAAADSNRVGGDAWIWRGSTTLQASREATVGAREFLQAHHLPDAELGSWELLLAEACNNAVLYVDPAKPETHHWELHLVVAADRVTARIIDHSAGFEWPETAGLPDDDSESGRGLFIITALTDYRQYRRSADGNRLTLERRLPAAVTSELADMRRRLAQTETTLDEMTEELAASFESLSAIFRFTAESRQTATLEEFGTRMLEHLATVTGADCGMLRIVSPVTGALTTLAHHGCEAMADCQPDHSPVPPEAAAVRTRQDQWIEATTDTVSVEHGSASIQAGLIHPFYDGDQLMGVLSLGRKRAEPMHAGDVSVIHTFAEFFAQHLLSRRQAEAAVQASAVRREIELAATIQRSLLPRSLPNLPHFSAVGHCESALMVGGDFYDLMPWDTNGYLFVIADVMGKGVGASMMAAVTRSIIRSLPQIDQSPASLLERAARLLYADFEHLEMFVTIAVGMVDTKRSLIRVSNLGHCPVLICSPDGILTSAEPEKPPLGLEEDPHYSETSVPLVPGTRILAYTDGLTDPRDHRTHFETPEDVARWFGEIVRTGASAAAIKSALLDRLGSDSPTANASPLVDDQTFLVIACDPS